MSKWQIVRFGSLLVTNGTTTHQPQVITIKQLANKSKFHRNEWHALCILVSHQFWTGTTRSDDDREVSELEIKSLLVGAHLRQVAQQSHLFRDS